MRRVLLLAPPVVLLAALGAAPLHPVQAQDAAGAIVVDTPPDFVRYGAEFPLTGTVFALDGSRSAKSPVSVATWDAVHDEYTWGRTVVTDANGRFRTSLRATLAAGSSVLVAPVLGRDDEVPTLIDATLPEVRLHYPVTVTVRKDPADPGNVVIAGTTPECDQAELQVESGIRSAFTPHDTSLVCRDGKILPVVVPRPGPGPAQYRVRRLADETSVTSVSPSVTLR